MKKLFYTTILCFYSVYIFSQSSTSLLGDAIKLFEHQNYAAALTVLQKCPSSTEKSFYEIQCRLFSEQNYAIEEAEAFLEEHKEHILAQKLAYEVGNFFYQKLDFKNASNFFSWTYQMPIYTQEQLKNNFQLAYSYFMLKRYDQAQTIFQKIKNGNHAFVAAAAYYSAYINYLNNKHENLVFDLKKAEKDPFFEQSVAQLLPIVWLKQGHSIDDLGIATTAAIQRLFGEHYLIENDFEKAISFFEKYEKTNLEKNNDLYFKMGYCYGKLSNFKKAIFFLEQVSEENPFIYQNAMYHLGVFALQDTNKQTAAAAFEKASQFRQNTDIQQESFLNAAKVYFELQDFHKCIVVSENYLSSFLQGIYQKNIHDLLGEAYLFTQNYEASLNFLDKLPKNNKMRYAYQRLFFNRAVELFHDEKYQQAVLILKNSLEYPLDKPLVDETYFLLGESYGQIGESQQAIGAYLKIPEISNFYKKSYYGLAYSFYKTNNLRKAINYFQEFVQVRLDSNRLSDGYLRLADCYFLQKNYPKALNFYDSAFLYENKELAYIDFQKALILKESKKTTEALLAFQRLEKYNTKNAYGIYARYQKALIWEKIDLEKAKNTYRQLIDSFPTHEIRGFSRQRLVEIYILQKQKEAAEQELSLLYKEFRGTPIALEAYKKLGELRGEVIAASKKEKEKVQILSKGINSFEKRNYQEAQQILENFVKENPQLPETNEAFYFLAESYANMGKFTEAILYYEKVQGIRRVEASLKAAEIELEKKNFEKAETKFQDVMTSSLDKKALERAKKGKINLQNQQGKTEYLKETPKDTDLVFAKGLLKEKKLEEALGQFRKIVKYYDGEKAAEAKYFIGEILRNERHFESSNTELQELIRRFSSYPHWTDKAYELMVDNYLDLNNKFQAKTALRELLKSKNPLTSQMAKVRLGKL